MGTLRNAWHSIVEGLEAENVRHLFGMPGNPKLLYDALYDSELITSVHAREQSSGAFMALAYARAAGCTGVCFGSTGPGFTNMLSAVLEAQAAATPLIVISASVSVAHEGMPAFQETDQLSMARPITKWAYRIPAPERTPWALRRAFQIARSGCPGPVYLEIPVDLSLKPTDIPPYERSPDVAPPAPDPVALTQAAHLLTHSKRPLLIAGGGAVSSQAFEELRAFAEEQGIPVLSSASGRGIIDENHPLALGLTGLYFTRIGREHYFKADLLLILGSRNEQFETGAWSYQPPHAKIIQVDIDATAINRNWQADIGITADVGSTLSTLRQLLPPLDPKSPRLVRSKTIQAAKASYLNEVHNECMQEYNHLKTKRVLAEYQEVFGTGSVLVNENGAQDLWSYYSPYMRVPVRGCVPPGAQTCMGAGVSGALGVKLARPEEQVVCVCGDGAFQMYMRELATAAQYSLGICYLVLNNRALGWIRYHQLHNKERYIDTSFEVQPDFAAVAEASGCLGIRVAHESEIRAAVEAAYVAVQSGQPAVLDCYIDDEQPPGFHDFHREVLGYKHA
ncbi:MAG: thiamine pyrophosphate-binding protein [Spirochaeta sp.]|nr:thiamine pyrophosphate-binding protein [Spirochaeta sp.]